MSEFVIKLLVTKENISGCFGQIPVKITLIQLE